MHKTSQILAQQKQTAKNLPPVVTIRTNSNQGPSGNGNNNNETMLGSNDDDDLSDIGSFGSAGGDDSSVEGDKPADTKQSLPLDISARSAPAARTSQVSPAPALKDKKLIEKIQKDEAEREKAETDLRKRHEAVKARVLAKVQTVIEEKEQSEAKSGGGKKLRRRKSDGHLIRLDSKKDLMVASEILKSYKPPKPVGEQNGGTTGSQKKGAILPSNSSRSPGGGQENGNDNKQRTNAITKANSSRKLGGEQSNGATATAKPKKKGTMKKSKSSRNVGGEKKESNKTSESKEDVELAKAAAELRRKHAELKSRVDKSKVEKAQTEAAKTVESVKKRAIRRKSLPASGTFKMPSIFDHIYKKKETEAKSPAPAPLPASVPLSAAAAAPKSTTPSRKSTTSAPKAASPVLPTNSGRKNPAPVLPANKGRRATMPATAFQQATAQTRKVVKAMEDKSKAAEKERLAAEKKQADQEQAIYRARDARRDEKQKAQEALAAQEFKEFDEKEREVLAASGIEIKATPLLSDKVYTAKIEATSEVERLKAAKLAKKAKRDKKRTSMIVTK
eukprot:Sro946_g223290.2  (561) ;mRNA; f:28690-30372